MGWQWDLATARSLAQTKQPADLAVAQWAALACLIPASNGGEEQGRAGSAGGADAGRPVAERACGAVCLLIAVPIPDAAYLIIDGWSRLQTALAHGIPMLPVVTLSAADERACRIRRGNDPPPTVPLTRPRLLGSGRVNPRVVSLASTPRSSPLTGLNHPTKGRRTMDDLCQPGPLSPPGEPTGITSASRITAAQAEGVRRSFDQRAAEKITSARQAYYAAAAETVYGLQNGRWLSSEQLFAAAYTQTSYAWWDRVDVEITVKRLASDHAVRRVRSWARHYLTGEPPADRPGTLFDHALAHAARMAARDFLNDSGQLLTQHIAAEPSAGADVAAPGLPVDHGHLDGSAAPHPTKGQSGV
jgi:hypothetical protein